MTDIGPEPRIWVTSLQRGACLRAFTAPSPPGPPPAFTVYVGRERGELAASPLANPFTGERGEAIARYATWLQARLQPGSSCWPELLRLLVLSLAPPGLALACWCAPQPCHACCIRDAVVAMWRAEWRA